MQYHNASLLKTAANASQWPVSDLPEIIFAGRSNAGKSSLINALTNRKNLAYAGKTPGKTRLLNFFLVDDRIVFTDAPGYGYATSDEASALAFSKLIDPYFRKRENLKGMVLVLDSRRVPNEDDVTMIDYGRAMHLPILVACTKVSKLSRSAWLTNAKKTAEVLRLPQSALMPVDSLQKKGLDDIWDKLNHMIER